jgi:hypothetical protein
MPYVHAFHLSPRMVRVYPRRPPSPTLPSKGRGPEQARVACDASLIFPTSISALTSPHW